MTSHIAVIQTPNAVISLGAPQQPFLGTIIEIQNEKTEQKRKQLARYAAQLWLLLNKPVEMLLICPKQVAADYYAEPIATDLPGYTFRAKVLGPANTPVITDAKEASTMPELALFGVLVHGNDRAVIEAFTESLQHLEVDYAERYLEHCHRAAGPAVQRILEELMASSTYLVSTPFAKEHFGKGKAEGRAEGRVEGEARAFLAVLSARGLTPTPQERDRITSCTDPDLLLTWIERAATVRSVAEIFG